MPLGQKRLSLARPGRRRWYSKVLLGDHDPVDDIGEPALEDAETLHVTVTR